MDTPPAPLEGIRIIELSDARGEFCGRLLAGLGAEVIKVEPPKGSPSRAIGPFFEDKPGPERSLYWWQYNAGKLGVTLDMSRPQGLRILHRLLEGADVLLESFGPGGLEKNGLGRWQPLHRRYPRLVALSISDFGLDGPWAHYQGSDLIALAMGGQVMTSGYPPGPDGRYDTPPMTPQMHQSWHILGCIGSMDVLAALNGRDFGPSNDGGQRIDLSVHAAVNNSTENHPAWYLAAGSVSPRRPQFPKLSTRDGKYMQVMGALHRDEFDRLVAMLDKYGMAADLKDPKYGDAAYRRQPAAQKHVEEVIQAFLDTQDAEEIFHVAQEHGVVWSPIRLPHENLGDAHMQERGSFIEIEHPEIGRKVTYPHSPWVSDEMGWRTGPRAPLIGEHNGLIYGERLGLSAREQVELRASGVI